MKVTDDMNRLVADKVQEAIDAFASSEAPEIYTSLDELISSLCASIENLRDRVEALENPVRKVVNPRKTKVKG